MRFGPDAQSVMREDFGPHSTHWLSYLVWIDQRLSSPAERQLVFVLFVKAVTG